MARYDQVNGAWPESLPVPTPKEAIAGARRLVRLAYRIAIEEGAFNGTMKRRKFKVVTGNRHTYPRSGVWCVNPNGRHFGGWRDIVHGISHWCGRRFWPNEKPHSLRHVWIERTMAQYVIDHFLNGQLVKGGSHEELTPRPDLRALRAARIAAKIKRWKTKAKRAETALRKLNRQARYYARTAGAPA